MDKLPILFVRYAPGAAGNFFISVLQTSHLVSCWNQEVEKFKNTDQFVSQFKSWFEQCFRSDLENHLKHEPHHPYCLDFFSSKHPRGDDITVDEFVNNLILRNDRDFLDNIKDNRLTVMRLNKSAVPKFGQGNTIVNIIVDPPSKKWFYKSRLIKLFGKDEQGWISKENHPNFLKAKYKKILFNNQYQFQTSKFQFLKYFVIGEPAIKPFFKKLLLLDHHSNTSCQQICINLSSIFDEESFVKVMSELFEKLELGRPDLDLIRWAHAHYYKHNIQPLLRGP